MPSVKLIAGFFLRLVVCYGVLMAPWPGLEEAYAGIFRAGAESVFGEFGSSGVVTYPPGPPTDTTHDTDLHVRNRENGAELGIGISSRYVAYTPTAFFLALLVATPLPWDRKGRALFWGLLGVHLFIGLDLLLQILYVFSFDHPVALFSLGPFWRRALAGMVQVVMVAPMFRMIVPTFIWIIVTFRREDVAGILAKATGNSSEPERAR